MASKYSYREIMAMNEAEFIAIASTSEKNKEWLKEAVARTEVLKLEKASQHKETFRDRILSL